MIYLATISKKGDVRDDTFPFNVPTIRTLQRIELRQPVTFLVGENGSGKSTLLEAIAAAAGSVVVGGEDIERDDSLEHARLLAAQLRLSWRKKTGRGFFLRAEDFFNFSKRINRTGQELQDIVAGYEAELERNPNDAGLRRAIGYIRGQKAALTSRYGENLDANSHGEGFMKLFESRLLPNGLYCWTNPKPRFRRSANSACCQ
jgi:predicted ATPase